MPYQDIDETASTATKRPPSASRRLLHKLFLEDRGLKLLAFAITLVLWFVVTGENEPITKRAEVQLNIIHPADLAISNDPPRNIVVVMKGSRQNLDLVTLLDLVATVEVGEQRPGERVLRLSSDTVQMVLPSGVKVESFQPNSISLNLEARIERQLDIEVELEGKPAEGYELYRAEPTRKTIRVRGPASHINALRKAPTEVISLEGKKASFTASNVPINIPDQKIEVIDPSVDVLVEIVERQAEKGFTQVPSLPDAALEAAVAEGRRF
jgi:YbbR domain-containing protein